VLKGKKKNKETGHGLVEGLEVVRAREKEEKRGVDTGSG